MAALTLGEDPGLGKTTLFKALFNSLETVGYTIETFESFSSKFNLGPVVTADIIYKDDLADKNLKQLTESGTAKSVISSSDWLKVQDKGVDAYNVFPKGVIICNTNNFNPRLVYGIDPGFVDRIKLISTIREAELDNEQLPPISQGTPDRRPFIHLDYLADKLKVNKNTLMLYFARMCADKFLSLIEDRTSLEKRVDYLTINLREILHKDSTSQLLLLLITVGVMDSIKAMRFCKLEKGVTIQDFHWSTYFNQLYNLIVDKTMFEGIKEALKEDFEVDKCNPLHPHLALKSLDCHSFITWSTVESVGHADKNNNALGYLENALKCLKMKSGLSYNHDRVWVVKAFSKVSYSLKECLRYAEIIEEVKKKYGQVR